MAILIESWKQVGFFGQSRVDWLRSDNMDWWPIRDQWIKQQQAKPFVVLITKSIEDSRPSVQTTLWTRPGYVDPFHMSRPQEQQETVHPGQPVQPVPLFYIHCTKQEDHFPYNSQQKVAYLPQEGRFWLIPTDQDGFYYSSKEAAERAMTLAQQALKTHYPTTPFNLRIEMV